ncbi:hypothetical protein F66182_3261 [Fusarium sp. NRRL 66182]|nr:hypothetical protein F66182_3261 [Fusarium sp. NRRL 66182]
MSVVVDAKRKRSEHDGRLSSPGLPKRQKTSHQDEGVPLQLSPQSYTVGWICALPIELAAAKALLDHVHDSLAISADDSNAYTLGDMCGHNVVMACLPARQYGNNNAATVANNMRRSFPSIRLGFMVGVGGGVPGRADIRLGDVVVSDQVVQYDLGKTIQDGQFQRTGTPVKPPPALMTAVSKLEANHALAPSEIPGILSHMIEKHTLMTEYTRHGKLQDHLFDSTYDHTDSTAGCDFCSSSRLIRRPTRPSMDPKIHHGVIASGNQVIKHGRTRDRLAQELGALCFEMEAAGVMDHFPCLVVRGICDYSDSHKNKQWQKYAAATAAAYTKELLSVIPRGWAKRTPQDNVGRRKCLLDSLSFDYIDSRRSTVKSQYSNTCEWLLTHVDYLDWSNPAKVGEHHGFLWIKGKPGAGKSTIMNFAHKQESVDKSHTVISFFFNARGDDLERSVIGMYRALLFQLLHAIPSLLKVFDSLEHEDKLAKLWDDVKKQKGDAQWDLEVLQSLLRSAVEDLGQGSLTCFIDALDECAEDEVEEMVEYFEHLGACAVSNKTRLRICFSSRHYPHIDIQHGRKLVLELQQGHEQDIAAYIQNKLKVGKNKTSDEIRSKMQKKAGGIFMWVVLVVSILNTEYKNGRIFAVKKRLDAIPTELSLLFKEILFRDQKNLQDMKLCIQWILFARRPLELEEYYFAVVSGLYPEDLREWDSEEPNRDDMYKFLLSSSKGLAEITKGATQTVQFIHESVREFFLKDGLRELWPDLKEDFECMSHDQLKRCCHNYTQLDVWARMPSHTELPQHVSDAARYLVRTPSDKFPFLNYATRQVLYHADVAAKEVSQQRFLAAFDLGAWINLDNLLKLSQARRHTPNASLVYILAEHNYARLIESALFLDPRINIEGEQYGYPLFAALANGHQDAVRALFQETGVIPERSISSQLIYGHDSRAFSGQTPLQWAMQYQHVPLVGRLISSEELSDSLTGKSGGEVLSWAAYTRNTEILEAMLAVQGLDINCRDLSGETPLSLAAMKGHQDAVRLLLGMGDIHLEPKNHRGLTPLNVAAAEGYEDIVKLLLDAGCTDVNVKNNLGQTLLSYAASNGHFGIMKLLLGVEGIQLNLRDDDGKTALVSAAMLGHCQIVRLLLSAGCIRADLTDNSRMMALTYATIFGHEEVKNLLV